jgi:hypothetical protein
MLARLASALGVPSTKDGLSDIAEYLEALMEAEVSADDLAAALDGQLEMHSIEAAHGVDLAAVAGELSRAGAAAPALAAADTALAPPMRLKEVTRIQPTAAAATSTAVPAGSGAPGVLSPPLGPPPAPVTQISEVTKSGLEAMASLDDWGSAWDDVVKSGGKW